MNELRVIPVPGIPDIAAGDDLAQWVIDGMVSLGGLHDGDVLVVTSKIVSKAEGRSRPGADRERAIDDETIAEVARKGPTRIVRHRLGLVLAAAGVDASNTDADTIVLLPEDPDRSARALRQAVQDRLGVRIAVVISDTMGRPWRLGLTDAAIGVAGLVALDDHRGRTDAAGRSLEMTITCIADEAAGAADLVKGKATGTPVAVVRGLNRYVTVEDGPGARSIVRPPDEDLFPLGSAEAHHAGAAQGQRQAVGARRTVRHWTDEPVPDTVIESAVTAALTAPAPHHTTPWRYLHLKDPQRRRQLLEAMEQRWQADLLHDGLTSAEAERRIERGRLLHRAPALVVPVVVADGAHAYPDERRRTAEHQMFVLSMGASVEGFLVQVQAQGWGAAWVSSTLFCPDDARRALELPEEWEPMGAIAIGRPAQAPHPRPPRDAMDFLHVQ